MRKLIQKAMQAVAAVAALASRGWNNCPVAEVPPAKLMPRPLTAPSSEPCRPPCPRATIPGDWTWPATERGFRA